MQVDTGASTTNPDMGSGDVIDRIADILEPTSLPDEGEAPVSAAEQPTDMLDTKPTEEQTLEEPTEEDLEEIEVEAEEGSKVENEEEDETEYLSRDDLAQYLGIKPDRVIIEDDGQLSFHAKVDGEVQKVNLNDLLKSHQTEAHVTRKSQTLAKEREEFEANKATETQRIQSQIGELASTVQMLEGQLTQEFSSIDWNTLRQTNPAEWTAKRQEFTDLVQFLDNAKARGVEVLRQQWQQNQQEKHEQKAVILRREAEALITVLPSWSDPELALQQRDGMQKFLEETYGYTEGAVDSVIDHRLILVALDAQKYRESLGKVAVAEKKLKKLPKLQKPGAKKNARKVAAVQAQNKKLVHLRNSGNTDSVASVLMDRI